MLQFPRPAKALSLTIVQHMEEELVAMRGETDPMKLRLSAEKARCWQSMALTVSRLAPLTDEPPPMPTPGAARPSGGPEEPTDAEFEARYAAAIAELDRRKPEIDALIELKAREVAQQTPQNRHARRAMEAKAGRG